MMNKRRKMTTVTGNVFEDLGFAPEESQILSLKAQLASMIVRVVIRKDLSQKELMDLWDVPQPRVSEVLNGKISLMSLERLIEFLALLDVQVDFKVRRTNRNVV
jgi:predicted XRE-type DNA-binding protein